MRAVPPPLDDDGQEIQNIILINSNTADTGVCESADGNGGLSESDLVYQLDLTLSSLQFTSHPYISQGTCFYYYRHFFFFFFIL